MILLPRNIILKCIFFPLSCKLYWSVIVVAKNEKFARAREISRVNQLRREKKDTIVRSPVPCMFLDTLFWPGVLLWRTPVVKFSTLRRDRKELPYRCTCAGGQTNLVRPPSRPSPPFQRFSSILSRGLRSLFLLTARRGFKIKSVGSVQRTDR